MREIPAELGKQIATGAAALCHVWLVTRADGAKHGFTDHDEDLEVDGVICAAASGWTAGAAEGSLGLQPGTAALTGALGAESISAVELESGAWDQARVELQRVDWTSPDLAVPLWTGRIARLTGVGERFTAEVEGPSALLDRVAGRTYGRTCDAELGDARCGLDLANVPAGACDKRFETCRGVFGNAANFRGFPDLPGEDFLTLTPSDGGRHDGGSRR